MTKEQYFLYKQQIRDLKQKQKNKEELTHEERKVLKNEKFFKFSYATCLVGASSFLAVLGLLVGGCYHGVLTEARLKEENKEALDTFRVEQVQKLNEEYDNGNGFSAAEYSERLEILEDNVFKDYMENAASEEVKMDYQNQTAIDNGLFISAGAIAAVGSVLALGGLAGGLATERKRNKTADKEYPTFKEKKL